MRRLLLAAILCAMVSAVQAQTWENQANPALQLKGAKVYAQDPKKTYLGSLTGEVEYDSIFNQVGPHGSKVSKTSIWNVTSPFGVDSGEYSAFNPVTKTPPTMVKAGKVVGYITVNKSIDNRISPRFLKSLKDQFGL
ncbi:MAG: hypothetical protein P8123_11310 [bacterium]